MALLWLEGFEGFGTTIGNDPLPFGAIARKYINVVNETNMVLKAGRIAGYSLQMPNAATFHTHALTTNATMVAGCAFLPQSGTDYSIMIFWDGPADKNMNIRWDDGTGEISVWRENTLLATTSGLGLSAGNWYYAELKAVTHNSNGSYEARINGVNVLSDSGIDTQTGANAYSDSVRFFGASSNPAWDDIYILDATGSINTDFLGNCKIVAIVPNGDDTANFGTSTPNASHYANVDENPSDDDTSYVEDGTANITDLYDYEDLVGSGSIGGIQINTMCRETDITPFNLVTPIESNGTQYDDAGVAIGSTSYVTKTRVVEADPNTSVAWTYAGVNAAKIGIKVG
jgi:hypothetical protein